MMLRVINIIWVSDCHTVERESLAQVVGAQQIRFVLEKLKQFYLVS